MDKLQNNHESTTPDDITALIDATREPRDSFMDVFGLATERPSVQSAHAEAVILRRPIEHANEAPSPSRLKKAIGSTALGIMFIGGTLFIANQFIDAMDHQAQHVQEVGDEYMKQTQDGGMDVLEP